ncbi:hypothetical protein ACQ859_23490 [Roseateles chitinivorans]|uniref:hypothetical protein n=1 Tax=Roseateles chitinivorans TaxID=2917965 RepID=UPI003D6732AC
MKFTANYHPHSAVFAQMSKDGLQEFHEGFLSNVPYCLDELFRRVWQSPEFLRWQADFSAASLTGLVRWLRTALRIVDRAGCEGPLPLAGQQLESSSGVDFTDESRQLIVAAGMYYGEVMVRQSAGVRWEQSLRSRKDADFGQAVISGDVVRPINPVRVLTSVAFGLMNGTESDDGLRCAFSFWQENIAGSREAIAKGTKDGDECQ